MESEKKVLTLRFIVRAGIFSALAIVLYLLFKFIEIPMFAPFLKLHVDEVPIFIASFAYGPLMGLVVIVIKTLVSLIFTNPAVPFIGEFADLVYSIAFILPAAFIYKRNRNMKGVIIGFVVGFVSEIVVSFFMNWFVMIPLYMKITELDGGLIKDIVFTYCLPAVLPFNAIKNAIVIAITLPTYKSLHRLIDRIHIR